MKRNRASLQFIPRRFYLIVAVLCIVLVIVLARMLYLTVLDRHFLRNQADARILRDVKVPAYRGMILSRNGVPLAISVPVDSIWINPQDFPATSKNIEKVAKIIGMRPSAFKKILQRNAKREFVYVKRDAPSRVGLSVQKLALPGIYLKKLYHRYYPQGPVDSQVVGYTNIDDQGQAGLELAFNKWLQGVPGKQQVVKDRLGQVVAVVDTTRGAKPGRDLFLSINNRIQFLSFQALKRTVKRYHAKSGSVVVLNPKTGEILAMVNMPTFDPNKPYSPPYGRYRNRAVTDIYEPGSTLKTFSIANALASGKYTPTTKIDTSPGWFMIGKNEVKDEINNGVLTVTQVLQKSSNVGAAKMTLSLPAESLVGLLQRLNFGVRTDSDFPGESAGILLDRTYWRPFALATLAFGYHISVTALQIAHAYTAIANKGRLCPVTFLKRQKPINCLAVIQPKVANDMLQMLRAVLEPGGTGTSARIPDYTVAGKTGTAYIAGQHGYNKRHHVSSFIGIAPVGNPRLVVYVVIKDPRGADYGGVVAAPAFAKIMSGALRILNVAPDDINSGPIKPVRPFPESN